MDALEARYGAIKAPRRSFPNFERPMWASLVWLQVLYALLVETADDTNVPLCFVGPDSVVLLTKGRTLPKLELRLKSIVLEPRIEISEVVLAGNVKTVLRRERKRRKAAGRVEVKG